MTKSFEDLQIGLAKTAAEISDFKSLQMHYP